MALLCISKKTLSPVPLGKSTTRRLPAAHPPRAIRPADPGPVLELSNEELGSLIDRRARVDPPPFPAPVDPHGYLLSLGGSPARSQLKLYGANVWAGAWRADAENWVLPLSPRNRISAAYEDA